MDALTRSYDGFVYFMLFFLYRFHTLKRWRSSYGGCRTDQKAGTTTKEDELEEKKIQKSFAWECNVRIFGFQMFRSGDKKGTGGCEALRQEIFQFCDFLNKLQFLPESQKSIKVTAFGSLILSRKHRESC